MSSLTCRPGALSGIVLAGFVGTAAIAAAPAEQVSNTLVGTWKLDVVRSKIDYAPLPQREMRAYEVIQNNGIKLSVEGIDGTGASYAYAATGALDGKDYPMPGGGTRNGGDSVSWKRIDLNTVAATVKKAGKIVNTTRLSVTNNAKLLTITETGTDQSGRTTHGLRVYDRQ